MRFSPQGCPIFTVDKTRSQMTQPFPFEFHTKESKLKYSIRFNDCDPMGHLNNSGYINYFVNAMEDFILLNYQVNFADELTNGIGWVVRDHNIFYIKPVKHHQTVYIKVEFVKILEKEFEVEMCMCSKSEEHIYAMIRSNFSCINLRLNRRSAHPDKVFFSLVKSFNPELAVYKNLSERYQELRKSKRKIRRAQPV